MMNAIIILGLIAGVLTTISQLPQAIKSFRTKHTADISFWMYLILFTGVMLWLVYGLIINDIPIIFANFFSGILVGSVLILKILYG